MATRTLREEVHLVDFGIRGMDLAYELLNEYEAVIFVDIAPRGEPAGTLTLIQPLLREESEASLSAHGMDPVKVLNLARDLGAPTRPTYVLVCEPEFVLDGENNPDVLVELSQPVAAAIEPAIEMITSLIDRINAVGVS